MGCSRNGSVSVSSIKIACTTEPAVATQRSCPVVVCFVIVMVPVSRLLWAVRFVVLVFSLVLLSATATSSHSHFASAVVAITTARFELIFGGLGALFLGLRCPVSATASVLHRRLITLRILSISVYLPSSLLTISPSPRVSGFRILGPTSVLSFGVVIN